MADNNSGRNPDSDLFKKLTRLLSSPLVNRRVQTYRKQRRRQLDKYKSDFVSASGRQFKKSSYNSFENLQANIMQNQNRAERYVDFDQMEFTPEIASAMDIYADEMTTHTQLDEMLRIDCANEEIKTILSNLYKNILNVNFNLFGWCRTMCKYGDYFLYLDIDEDIGIKSVIGLPPQEVERLEGEDEDNPNYVQFQWNSAGMTFENWQMAHFRILGNDKYVPYGTSILEPARRIWRQLTLLEDAMMAYRIVRSPERRVFYIDVGNIAAQDVEQYMQKIMTQMKRNQVVDTNTGRVDLRYNPLSIEEDYFMPTRGGASSKIEALPGGTYTGDIDDVKYLRDKLFSALKIPQSYLSQEGDEDKTTLAQKDIRFARTIQRLQRAAISELEKIGVIHLHTLGFEGQDLISFTLSLNNPSKLAEMQELEHWRTKFEVASSATEGFFSKRWVAVNVFGLSEEQFLRNQREIYYDRKYDADVEREAAGEEAGGAEGDSIGMGSETASGGDLDLGGEGGEDDMAFGDEESGEETGEEPGGDESALLAAPGKREDEYDPFLKKSQRRKMSTTPKSKGKYHKVAKYHGGDKRGKGAKHRHNKSLYGDSVARATERNVMGYGSQELKSLTYGITEGGDSNNGDEQVLLEANKEIKDLISSLANSKEEKASEREENAPEEI